MCGIAGIVHKDHSAVDFDLIKRSTDLIKHRGPDAEGHYLYKNVALGHRRLSIIDIAERSNQPMSDDDLVITYNGEIYNYIELKNELKKKGHSFITNSDTEVILKAYREWGVECMRKFNGMWSFCILDKKRDVLILSRDRYGIKPMYLYQNNKSFIFGSEIKQILDISNSNTFNKATLINYLIGGFESIDSNTFFNDIATLKPGKTIEYYISNNEVREHVYYKLENKPEYNDLKLNDVQSSFNELLNDSINLRLRSDVKIGACLSGGLDSSSIASIASILFNGNGKFQAVNAKSFFKGNDESAYAKQVSNFCNLELNHVEPDKDAFLEIVDKLATIQEEPFGSLSIAMQYFVFEKAKSLGIKVMLDGQGGDEALMGYEKYYPSYLMNLPLLKRIFEFNNIAGKSKLTLKQAVLYYFYFTIPSIRLKRLFNNASFLSREYKDVFDQDIVRRISFSYKDIFSLQVEELTSSQLPHLLKYEDKNSMCHSIESRLPFLDFRLIDFLISINHKFKIKDGWSKYLLRNSVDDKLPKSITWRTNKFGFEAPPLFKLIERKTIAASIKNSKIIKEVSDKNILIERLPSNLIWRLYNISLWENNFNLN